MRKYFPIFLVGSLFLVLASCKNPYTVEPQTGMMAPQVSGSGQTLHGKIILAPQLAAKPGEQDVIFIIARSEASGPPLAVKKMASGNFPLEFELTGADVMIPGTSFSGAVNLVVRVDRDGSAGPAQSGDLEGRTAAPVKVGDQNIEVVVDTVIP